MSEIDEIIDKYEKSLTYVSGQLDTIICKLDQAQRRMTLLEESNKQLTKENVRMRRIIEGVFDE